MVDLPSVAGRYQVREALGSGGFAMVYRAHDPVLDREVALKLLHPHLAQDSGIRERFVREGRALARVRHPNIVQVHDAGDTDTTAYIAMELIEGRSLEDILDERSRLPLGEALAIADQVAAALAAVHARHLVHRDVKPVNILIEHDTGRAVLLDLGVARDMMNVTMTNSLMLGTPGFMAPEQVVDGGHITPQTDVYQLGCTVYTALAGRPPFEGEPFRILDAIMRSAPPDLGELRPDLPPGVVATVAEAMAKDPARRPQGARAFAAALRAGAAVAGGAPRLGRAALDDLEHAQTRRVDPRTLPPASAPVWSPPLPLPPYSPPRRRRALPLAVGGLGALAAIAVGLGVFLVGARGNNSDPSRSPTAAAVVTTAASAASPPVTRTATAAPSSTSRPTGTPTAAPRTSTPTTAAQPRTATPVPATDAAAMLRLTMNLAGYTPDGPVVDVPATGGTLHLQKGICAGSANGRCQLVFIYLDERFLGTDTLAPSAGIGEIKAIGKDRFSVTYAHYAPNDPGCCPSLPPVTIQYTWDGTKLIPAGTPPGH